MAKLKLVANPTFKAKVAIPVAGSAPVPVEFTFKHRTKAQLDEFIKSREKAADVDSFIEMVEAWDIEGEEYTKEAVETFLQNYIGAALATYRAYVDELVQAKVKN